MRALRGLSGVLTSADLSAGAATVSEWGTDSITVTSSIGIAAAATVRFIMRRLLVAGGVLDSAAAGQAFCSTIILAAAGHARNAVLPRPVVRRFLRDRDVVRVTLAQPRRADA